MGLRETREELIDQLEENISIVAAGHPLATIGDVIEDTAACFQALACCNLMLSADLQRFHTNLVYSALTRRWFLLHSRAEGNVQDEHLAISRSGSFFDAVAAKMTPLAVEIADLSPSEWMPDGEYEDDFCYYAFFHHFVRGLPNPGSELLAPLVERFARVAGDDTPPRLRVCRAFLLRDNQLFDDAFGALLDQRKFEASEQALSDDPAAEMRRHVFVEALALLQLAEAVGFQTAAVYPYCPELARTFPALRMPEDLYARLDAEFPRP